MFFIDSKAKDCMWHSSFDNTDIISRGPIWDGSTFPRKSKKRARFFLRCQSSRDWPGQHGYQGYAGYPCQPGQTKLVVYFAHHVQPGHQSQLDSLATLAFQAQPVGGQLDSLDTLAEPGLPIQTSQQSLSHQITSNKINKIDQMDQITPINKINRVESDTTICRTGIPGDLLGTHRYTLVKVI